MFVHASAHTHEIWNLHTKQTLVAIKFKRPTHATWPAFVHAELKETILALKQKKHKEQLNVSWVTLTDYLPVISNEDYLSDARH